jgi:3',5'-cyclic AMP phosphodiesterase CpdA
MRLAVLADLHGHAGALEAALADARRRGVDRLVLLGDLLGYGCEVEATLDLVQDALERDRAFLQGSRLAVFEINARFSGTTPLRHLAGFPEATMALRHLLLGEPLPQPQIRPLVLLRHLAETAIAPEEVLRPG